DLFVGTVVGFLGSTLLVILTVFPKMVLVTPSPFVERLTRGTKVFWRSRELRSLLAMNLTVAASTAWVIVNTVVLVQGDLNRSQADVALLLGAYGGGSMVVRSEEHTSELQSRFDLVCRLLLEKKTSKSSGTDD